MNERRLTEAEIMAQIPAAEARGAEEERTQPRAVSALYDATTERIVVELRNGCMFAFPTRLAQGLRGAGAAQLGEVEVEPGGESLHWEMLDVDLGVPGLVSGVFGGERWMRELALEGAREAGRQGGSVQGGAKAEAARRNGAKGGRPRKTPRADAGLT
jgi:hypothetical protein